MDAALAELEGDLLGERARDVDIHIYRAGDLAQGVDVQHGDRPFEAAVVDAGREEAALYRRAVELDVDLLDPDRADPGLGHLQALPSRDGGVDGGRQVE